MMGSFSSPVPLSDIESVLAWVDTYKLSRQTKKISRDFSDAVLLAEILGVHYPKLVEMHNYPPRNSQALKLNNWMTLNRKVLKKLKLTLCTSTMEQLANNTPGVIEKVLLMVRDKIRRDEEANRSMRDSEQNLSSGGSYYEACGDDENVLVVPLKTRVNGYLETIQQKVVSHASYLTQKQELKDAKEVIDVLKQKVEHLDSLVKLKNERIEDLQKQLERKQARRKEVEVLQNSLQVPYDSMLSPEENEDIFPVKVSSTKLIDTKIYRLEESKIPISRDLAKSTSRICTVSLDDNVESNFRIDKIKLDDYNEIEIIEMTGKDMQDVDEFKDSVGEIILGAETKDMNEYM
ncbi:PREDICTED: sperm flagellar protein 1-like [Papilio xuthus]|uniref:Sperm flagellar protein 1 n=1 Tax=Papilio xuthus TaxID=66420 RepID=A0A194PRD9_PAPXU|nr:PREDICTED: sperm flagellar protein 1-like [Papilio xuthus]KPI93695.1 Sperm flagellar protein 1 [Papilio xuthus]